MRGGLRDAELASLWGFGSYTLAGGSITEGGKILLTVLRMCDSVPEMKRQWELCTVDVRGGRWIGFYATMDKKGQIYINGNAAKALGDPERFELYYDRATNSIGIKPSNTLSKFSQKGSAHGPRGGKRIRAFRLLRQFQINMDASVRFLRPEIDDDGMLVLDLRQTTPARRR